MNPQASSLYTMRIRHSRKSGACLGRGRIAGRWRSGRPRSTAPLQAKPPAPVPAAVRVSFSVPARARSEAKRIEAPDRPEHEDCAILPFAFAQQKSMVPIAERRWSMLRRLSHLCRPVFARNHPPLHARRDVMRPDQRQQMLCTQHRETNGLLAPADRMRRVSGCFTPRPFPDQAGRGCVDQSVQAVTRARSGKVSAIRCIKTGGPYNHILRRGATPCSKVRARRSAFQNHCRSTGPGPKPRLSRTFWLASGRQAEGADQTRIIRPRIQRQPSAAAASCAANNFSVRKTPAWHCASRIAVVATQDIAFCYRRSG